MTSMNQLVCVEPRTLLWQRRKKPTAQAGEALLKIIAAGICGTDIHAWGGNQPFFSYPRVLGHELCGEVVALGSGVTDLQIGQRVALIPYLSCLCCDVCLSGKTNCCENISVIGVHQDGGFCDFLSVPASNLLAVDALSIEATALIEPFAISAHAVRRAAIQPDDHLLVVGAGPIGLGVAAIAAAAGAKVVVADTSEFRRDHVVQQLGLMAVNPMDTCLDEVMRTQFNGMLAAKVIDATGSPSAMNNVINLLRHGGNVVFVGLHKGDLVIPDSDFHRKEATLMGSRNATREDFDKVCELMDSGKIRADMMFNQRFAFARLAEEFEERVINNRALIKGIVIF